LLLEPLISLETPVALAFSEHQLQALTHRGDLNRLGTMTTKTPSPSASAAAAAASTRSPVEEMQRALARVGRSSRAARIHAVLRLHGRAVAGVVAEHPDAERCTALHVAAQTARAELAADLLAIGGGVVDVDARDARAGTPLHFAVVNDALDVAQLLLDAGANLDAADVDGNTPLHDAVVRNREDAVRLLVDRGASRALRNNQGKTPADVAESFSLHGLLPLVREQGIGHESLNSRRKQQEYRVLLAADKPDTPKRPRCLPEAPNDEICSLGTASPSHHHHKDGQNRMQTDYAFHVPKDDVASRPRSDNDPRAYSSVLSPMENALCSPGLSATEQNSGHIDGELGNCSVSTLTRKMHLDRASLGSNVDRSGPRGRCGDLCEIPEIAAGHQDTPTSTPNLRQCRVVPPPSYLPSIAVAREPRDNHPVLRDVEPAGPISHSEVGIVQAVVVGMPLSASEQPATDSAGRRGHDDRHRVGGVGKQSGVLQVPGSGATSIRPESQRLEAAAGKNHVNPPGIGAVVSQEIENSSSPQLVSSWRPIVACDVAEGDHSRKCYPEANVSSHQQLSSEAISGTCRKSDISETLCWPSSSLLRRIHTLSPDELEHDQSSNFSVCNVVQTSSSVAINGTQHAKLEPSSTTLDPLPCGTVSVETTLEEGCQSFRSMPLDAQAGDIRIAESVDANAMNSNLLYDQSISTQRPTLSTLSDTTDVGSCLDVRHVVGSGSTLASVPESGNADAEGRHDEHERTDTSGNRAWSENISVQSTKEGHDAYAAAVGHEKDTGAIAAESVGTYRNKVHRSDTPRFADKRDYLGLQQKVMRVPGPFVFQERLWVESANEPAILTESKSSMPLDDCDAEIENPAGMKLSSVVAFGSKTPPAILGARKSMEEAIGMPSCKSDIVEIESLVEAFGSVVSGVKSSVRDLQTPLHCAAVYGNVKLARLLAGDSADVEAMEARFGRTPLHFAAQYGNAEITEVLVHEFKANTNALDRLGNTALDLAISSGDQATIDVFSDPGMTSKYSLTSRKSPTPPDALQRFIMPKALGGGSRPVTKEFSSVGGIETESANSSDELYLNGALRRRESSRIAPKTGSVAVKHANSGYSSSASDDAQILEQVFSHGNKSWPSDEARHTLTLQAKPAVLPTASCKEDVVGLARGAEHERPNLPKVKRFCDRSVSDVEVVGEIEELASPPCKGSPTARAHLFDGLSGEGTCNHEQIMVPCESSLKPVVLHEDSVISSVPSDRSSASCGIRDKITSPTTRLESTDNTATAYVVMEQKDLNFSSSPAQALPNCMMVPERLMEAAIGLPDMDSDCARIVALVETYGKSLVNFRAKQRGGQTALHRAAFHQHVPLLELLLRNGADPNTRDDRFRSMSLHTAASNGCEAAVDALVRFGADVNAQSMFGAPLHLAAWHNQARLVHKLLKYGADITVRNANGLNPRDVARARSHDQIVQLFDKYLSSHEEL
jgi:ankyrin repeat protein